MIVQIKQTVHHNVSGAISITPRVEEGQTDHNTLDITIEAADDAEAEALIDGVIDTLNLAKIKLIAERN